MKLILVEPFEIADAAISVSRGTDKANLVDPERKHVFFDAVDDGTTLTIDIDLGAVTNWDTVALVGLGNAASAATWRLLGGVAAYGESVFMAARSLLADDALGPPYNAALFKAAAPVNGRFVRIELDRPAGAGELTIGCIIAGLSWAPTWNVETDSGRGVIDTGIVTRRQDGGRSSVPGVRVPRRSWIFGDLSDAELRQLYGIVFRSGESRPLLVCEDPEFTAGQSERTGWGEFTNLEAYRRRDPTKHRWSLEFEDWL